jgi:hypothetical protein
MAFAHGGIGTAGVHFPSELIGFLRIESTAKVMAGAGIFHNCLLPVKTLGRVRARIGGRGFS